MKQQSVLQHPGLRLAALLVLVLLTAGCARTAPVAYYQLAAIAAALDAREAGGVGDAVIGLGPVGLPELLDRQQIVIRQDANRLLLSDGHRWAEPLAENFLRVLRENLSARLHTERFLLHPWPLKAPPDYQVIIDVLRFEGDVSGAACLEAVWSVRDGQGKILLPRQRDSYEAAASGSGRAGTVAALSETLARFSGDIARQLTLLHASHPLE